MCQCGSIVMVEKHNTVTTWMRNSDKNKKDKHTRLEVTEAVLRTSFFHFQLLYFSEATPTDAISIPDEKNCFPGTPALPHAAATFGSWGSVPQTERATETRAGLARFQ